MSDIASTETTETQATETADTTQESTVAETTTQEPNYEYVPKKFLKEGKPDFESLVKSYTHLETKLGSKGNIAPESVDAYEYEPKAIQLDPELSKVFKNEALEKGLTKEQYSWLMEKYEGEVSNLVQTPEKATSVLKEAWKDNFDTNLNLARKAFEEFAPSDISIDEVGNNPAVLKILARIGAEMKEDDNPSKASITSGVSREDIMNVIKEPDYYQNAAKQKQVSEWFKANP